MSLLEKTPASLALGKKLRELRIETGLTQEKMGELFELSAAAWRHYELGIRIPNDRNKKRIAVYFNKTVDELFF